MLSYKRSITTLLLRVRKVLSLCGALRKRHRVVENLPMPKVGRGKLGLIRGRRWRSEDQLLMSTFLAVFALSSRKLEIVTAAMPFQFSAVVKHIVPFH